VLPVAGLIPLLLIAARVAGSTNKGSGRGVAASALRGGAAAPTLDGWVALVNGAARFGLCIGFQSTLVLAIAGDVTWIGVGAGLVLGAFSFPTPASELAVRLGLPRVASYFTRVSAPWWTGRDPAGWAAVQAARALRFQRRPPSPGVLDFFADTAAFHRPTMSAQTLLARGLTEAGLGNPASARASLHALLRLKPMVERRRPFAIASAWLVADAGQRADWNELVRLCRDNPGRAGDLDVLGELVASSQGLAVDHSRLSRWGVLRRPRACRWWKQAAAARARPAPVELPPPPQSGDPIADAVATHAWLLRLGPSRVTRPALSLHSARWRVAADLGRATVGRRVAALGSRRSPEEVLGSLADGFRDDLLELLRAATLPGGTPFPEGSPAEEARVRLSHERADAFLAQSLAFHKSGNLPNPRRDAWVVLGQTLVAWEAFAACAAEAERPGVLEEGGRNLINGAADLCNRWREAMLGQLVFDWLSEAFPANGVGGELLELALRNAGLTR